MNIERSAWFSACDKYRYVLRRTILRDSKHTHGKCVFILLNPSTADAETDDPTTRRCMNFAFDMGFNEYVAVNLFALRSPNPKDLRGVDDPVGEGNDTYIVRELVGTTAVFVAWGNGGSYQNRANEILDGLESLCVVPLCLGITKTKEPSFPLYLSNPFCPRPYMRPAR